MPRAEGSQVENARGQHQCLPDDRDLDPALEALPHLFDAWRLKRFAQQAVIKTVLNGKSHQERGQAEPQERALAQRSPTPSRCEDSAYKPALGPSGRQRSHGPSAGWAGTAG